MMTETKHTPGPMTPEKAARLYSGCEGRIRGWFEEFDDMPKEEQEMEIRIMADFLSWYSSAPALAAENKALRDNNRALARALEVTTEGQIQENYCLVEDALAKHRELEPAGDEGTEATPGTGAGG